MASRIWLAYSSFVWLRVSGGGIALPFILLGLRSAVDVTSEHFFCCNHIEEKQNDEWRETKGIFFNFLSTPQQATSNFLCAFIVSDCCG